MPMRVMIVFSYESRGDDDGVDDGRFDTRRVDRRGGLNGQTVELVLQLKKRKFTMRERERDMNRWETKTWIGEKRKHESVRNENMKSVRNETINHFLIYDS